MRRALVIEGQAPPNPADLADEDSNYADCTVEGRLKDRHLMLCWLRPSHGGPHWDDVDKVWWTTEAQPA